MEDSLKNLSVLFRDTLFRIPDYQRGYAWEKKQIEDFWNDLNNIDNNKLNDHYAGVITTQLIPKDDLKKDKWNNDRWLIDKKRYNPIYLVDGQQRITTAILLISAIVKVIEEKFPSKKEINFTSIDNIKERFLYEKKSTSDIYSCIFGYESTDTSYNFYCEEILNIPNFGKTNIRTKYTENIKDAFSFFETKLKKLSFEQIEDLYMILTNNLVFNLYQISDKLDVFVTFETMNNRGKMLSNLELLKNRFIYLTTLAPIDVEDITQHLSARDIINDSWKTIYSYLGKNEKRMLEDQEFLFAHCLVYKSNSNEFIDQSLSSRNRWDFYNASILLDTIFTRNKLKENKITLDDIIHFSQRLAESSQYWFEINNPGYSNFSSDLVEEIYKFNLLCRNSRIYRHNDNPIIILFRFFKNESDDFTRLQFLKYLSKYCLAFVLFEEAPVLGRKIIDIHLELMESKITKDKIVNASRELRTTLRAKTHQDLIFRVLLKNIKNGSKSQNQNRMSYYENYMFPTEYILKLYELALINENEDATFTIQDKINYLHSEQYTIEHVYPTNDTLEWKSCLSKDFSTAERYNIKNNIGNLVYISTNKNNRLKNKPFTVKKGVLGSKVGFINGTYSEKEIAQNEVWTEQEICDRGIRIISFFWDLLHLPKISNTKKKELLGLSFL